MVAVNIDINTLFFGLSLSAFVIVFIPFYWHLKARNTGTCLFMAWIGLACLVLSMDSFFWKRNTSNFAPIWCDISSKFLIGANAAISSVSLCLNLRLWLVASDRVRTLEVHDFRSNKRSVFVIELLLGLGIPVLEMTFQYFVQDRRFDIYEGVGCRAASDNVLLMYLLLLAPQFLLGIASTTFFILACINYHRVYKYMLETQYSPTFHHRTTLSASFPCFLTLGGISILCSIAYAAFAVYFNATASDTLGSFTLWESWTSTHLNIKKVNVYNEKEWRGDMMTELLLEANRWIFVGLAFLFFVTFGLATEARRRYRRLFGCGGRRNCWFQAERTAVGADDRGIVHYADGDTESAEGYVMIRFGPNSYLVPSGLATGLKVPSIQQLISTLLSANLNLLTSLLSIFSLKTRSRSIIPIPNTFTTKSPKVSQAGGI
ncbi:pheromone A receptor-domain-containing protein [Lentinula aff. detonsa]|uniref:Pheromone A receptor-domain-containing protein n=1 Tax=Lentinula aff. detonsa TaxID=2804958 RepID=A0AA38KQI8_9AGAR|nr:pheromone A receptor-domain-containing protein [Lentinula aff. detonsa]